MAAGLHITRLLLSCLLSEVCYSVAYPRVRGFAPSRSEQPRENHSFIRRPLEYNRALWKHHEDTQPKASDQFPDPNWQKPQGNPWRLGNHGLQIQNKPGLYQTWMPHYARSHFHTNHAPPKPKSFEFNMKIPFLNFGQKEETHEPKKVSSGAGVPSHLYKPSSVEIQSSFNGPSNTGDIPNKGSKIPNGKNDPHNVPKPSFNFSFSLPLPPIPSIGLLPKPTKSDGGKVVPTKSPGLLGIKPSIQQGYTTPGHYSKFPDKVQQHQPVNKPVDTKPTHIHWLDHFHDHADLDKGPTAQNGHGKVILKPVVPKPSYQPVPFFPGLQSVSGSNTGQPNPTNHYVNIQTWPLLSAGATDTLDPVHSPPASAFHHRHTFKPSTSYYGGLEKEHPDLSQPVVSSDRYHWPHLHSPSSHGWNSEPARPSSESHHAPSSTHSLYDLLTSGRHNAAFYDGRGSSMQPGSSGSSFWDHPNIENDGHGATHHYHTTSRELPNPHSLNIRYTSHNQGNVKPHHGKHFIGVDDKNSNTNSHSHKDDGRHRYILPQGTRHGYPFGLPGHSIDRTYTVKPDSLPFPVLKPQLAATSWLHHQHQPTVYGFKQTSADYLKPLEYTPYQGIRPLIYGGGPGRIKYIADYRPQTESNPDKDQSYRRYIHPAYYD